MSTADGLLLLLIVFGVPLMNLLIGGLLIVATIKLCAWFFGLFFRRLP